MPRGFGFFIGLYCTFEGKAMFGVVLSCYPIPDRVSAGNRFAYSAKSASSLLVSVEREYLHIVNTLVPHRPLWSVFLFCYRNRFNPALAIFMARIGFAYHAQSASSLLVSGKREESSPKANTLVLRLNTPRAANSVFSTYHHPNFPQNLAISPIL